MRRAMIQGGLLWLALVGLATGYEIQPRRTASKPSAAVSPPCAPPRVLGADGHCIFKEQCPDGSLPNPQGKCISADAIAPQPTIVNTTCKTMLLPSSPIPPQRSGCSGSKPAVVRKVFLTHGKLQTVFEKYLHDAEQQGQRIDLHHLTVIYFDKQNEQRALTAPRMKLANYFAGKTMMDLWRKALRDEEAQPRRDPLEDAKQVNSDLCCGE